MFTPHCQDITIPLDKVELQDLNPRPKNKDSIYRFTGPFNKRVYSDCPAFYSKFYNPKADRISVNGDSLKLKDFQDAMMWLARVQKQMRDQIYLNNELAVSQQLVSIL